MFLHTRRNSYILLDTLIIHLVVHRFDCNTCVFLGLEIFQAAAESIGSRPTRSAVKGSWASLGHGTTSELMCGTLRFCWVEKRFGSDESPVSKVGLIPSLLSPQEEFPMRAK